MRKIFIIVQREFLVRARKKSFQLMTIAGPLLLGLVMIVPVWVKTSYTHSIEKILVVDETGTLSLPIGDGIVFSETPLSIESAKDAFLRSNDLGLLYVPVGSLLETSRVRLFTKKKLPFSVINYIEKILEPSLQNQQLKKILNANQLKYSNSAFHLRTQSFFQEYEDENGEAAGGIGIFLAFLIYFFILLYGLQVMRSVMEEKTSRIIEVLISSVKPFQIMFGKILGVALVSLSQFFIWISLSAAIGYILDYKYGKALHLFENSNMENILKISPDVKQVIEMNLIISAFQGINIVSLLIFFPIFFVCGYLFYSSIFAAVGSLTDTESDIQQFILPVTLPLFISLMLISVVVERPHGAIAYWFSLIPMTSPIIMMVRLPYGVPPIQLFLSVSILIASFITSTWCASKIYRTGILLHGKKFGYVEIIKLLFLKN